MPVVASATLEVTPVLSGAQQSLTEQLTGEASKAGEAAGKEAGSKTSSGLVKGLAAGSAAVAGAVVGVGTALVGAAGATAEYGDQIDKASQKLGVSSTFYQEWEAVLQHSGTSMNSMSATFKKLATASQDASADQQAAFEALGMSMDEVSSMSAEDLFANVISGLQGMEEGTERTALATTLLGKGAMELGPLLNTSAEDTQAMIDTVNDLGGVMSEDAVKASAAYQDSLQDMQTAFSGVKNGLAADLLPVMSEFMTGISDFITGTDLSPITDTLGSAVSALGDFISGLDIEAIGNTFQTVVSACGDVVGTAWDVIKTVFDSLKSGFKTITDALGDSGTSWDDVWSGIQSIISDVAAAVGLAIKTIAEAIAWVVSEAQTEGTLFNAVWEGIQTAVQAAQDVISGVIDFVTALLNGDWGQAWESAKNIVQTIWNAIKTTLSNTWNAIKTTAKTLWNNIKEAVKEPIETLKTNLSTTWQNIKSTATTWWENVKSAITSPITKAKDTVKDIIDKIKGFFPLSLSSVWNSITSKLTSPISDAKEGISGIIEKIKGFFPLSVGKIFSNIKLPHFNISGGEAPWGIGGKGTKPSISIDWYARAMNDPYMFQNATLFGAGEAGDEILYGREALLSDIKEAVGSGRQVVNYITVNGAEDPEAWAAKFARQMKMEMRMA